MDLEMFWTGTVCMWLVLIKLILKRRTTAIWWTRKAENYKYPEWTLTVGFSIHCACQVSRRKKRWFCCNLVSSERLSELSIVQRPWDIEIKWLACTEKYPDMRRMDHPFIPHQQNSSEHPLPRVSETGLLPSTADPGGPGFSSKVRNTLLVHGLLLC